MVWDQHTSNTSTLVGAALSTGATLPMSAVKALLQEAKDKPNWHVGFCGNHFEILEAPKNFHIHLENTLAVAHAQLNSQHDTHGEEVQPEEKLKPTKEVIDLTDRGPEKKKRKPRKQAEEQEKNKMTYEKKTKGEDDKPSIKKEERKDTVKTMATKVQGQQQKAKLYPPMTFNARRSTRNRKTIYDTLKEDGMLPDESVHPPSMDKQEESLREIPTWDQKEILYITPNAKPITIDPAKVAYIAPSTEGAGARLRLPYSVRKQRSGFRHRAPPSLHFS